MRYTPTREATQPQLRRFDCRHVDRRPAYAAGYAQAGLQAQPAAHARFRLDCRKQIALVVALRARLATVRLLGALFINLHCSER